MTSKTEYLLRLKQLAERPSPSAELLPLLRFITKEVYDSWHRSIPLVPAFVVDADHLLEHLAEAAGMTREEMREMYDLARVQVQGPDCDLD